MCVATLLSRFIHELDSRGEKCAAEGEWIIVSEFNREEFDRISGELITCHKSHLCQVRIVEGLRKQVRGLSDAASRLSDLATRKANLIDQLLLELEQQEPRIALMLDFISKIEIMTATVATPAPMIAILPPVKGNK
jgi:hypothetical protein